MKTCPFCQPEKLKLAAENLLAFAVYDLYPVNLGHCLIIPKRHVSSFFELMPEEVQACFELLQQMKNQIDSIHGPVTYNIGINDGPDAGQSIPHVHIHLIPRYKGDSADPRGGVRLIFPERAIYTGAKKPE